ncbi:MAG: glycosyltransferase [Mesorhizobium sp.]|uniref:glycosyltransferase family 2 protein n=1 Tax=unclassified Mesorhizobium TaxID=325217 RepID=UPI000F759BE7|nr:MULTISPECIES: glycosyltransferase family 2 protein [unclassified Mesorhizobium]AZO20606.1 glycosyltransferase [Mesorhizobium sp. M1E.F.Ca.ET.045.02.1.1]RUW84249.1 glycosyltransferase [Mesorhizobium sp. M1E.F.Ca.ET.063.01.1.1]TIU35017.1 MAG: glycosyltransferase [Mesorhizobium sp.]
MNAPFLHIDRTTPDRLARPKNGLATITLIIPVHNEEAAIAPFLKAVREAIDPLRERAAFEFIFVNDGSNDATLDRLIEAQRADPRINVIDLSRNFGKEAALTAGLDACDADAAIPIDVDLQDPPDVIPLLVDKWREGYEVVLAKRADRSSDSFLKQRSASLFYRVHNWIAQQKIPDDVGDFRLIDRQVIDALRSLPERRRFMKGLFAWVGFRTATVEYVRDQRIAGQSKFSGWRLWNFALEGITSFSTAPLEIWTYVGAAISALSFLYGLVIIAKTLLFGIDVPGYASLLVSVLFLGGIQLLGIGIIGQYLGRVYAEIKQRPIYIVRRVFGGGN